MIELLVPQKINLPSRGVYYPNKCSAVNVYDITMADEQLLYSPTIRAEGKLFDIILEKKVRPIPEEPFIHPSKMLLVDRFAIIIHLRSTMGETYKFMTKDSKGKDFMAEIDVNSILKVKDAELLPNAEGIFDYKLPSGKANIKYRLMVGEDEANIRIQANANDNKSILNSVPLLTCLITSINGETDKGTILAFVNHMSLQDGHALVAEIEKSSPSIDLNVEIKDPYGVTITREVDISSRFFFPNT